ncbi:enhancer of polycomb-like-domain-containing protein [Obelidium mucronatum]|nr:enhancer of polycomb-like-domain-containing protein [Obelidium mucronatum]
MALRSRKLDYKRKFQVFRWNECLDIDDTALLGRGVPNIKTGVDKEEEDEHHLRAALDANQAGVVKQSVVIPVPDASAKFADYEKYYSPTYVISKNLVKFAAQMDDYVGSSYCLDEVDDEFLNAWKLDMEKKANSTETAVVKEGEEAEVLLDEDAFEHCMDLLERFGNERLISDLPTMDDAITFFVQNEPSLSYPPATFERVFNHWIHRRYNTPRIQVTNMNPGRPIAPPLRVDDFTANPKQDDSDPYICFRKRDLRPARKHTKRVDMASLDKLKKLHQDLIQVRNMLDHVSAREETRRELLAMDTAFFEKRCLVRRLKRTFGVADGDENKKKKRRTDEIRPSSIKIKLRNPSSDNLDLIKSPIDPVSEDVRILEQIKKRKADDEAAGFVDLTENPYIPPTRPGSKFWERSFPTAFHSTNISLFRY